MCVDVLQVSMLLSVFLGGETYIQICRQNMTHTGESAERDVAGVKRQRTKEG